MRKGKKKKKKQKKKNNGREHSFGDGEKKKNTEQKALFWFGECSALVYKICSFSLPKLLFLKPFLETVGTADASIHAQPCR